MIYNTCTKYICRYRCLPSWASLEKFSTSRVNVHVTCRDYEVFSIQWTLGVFKTKANIPITWYCYGIRTCNQILNKLKWLQLTHISLVAELFPSEKVHVIYHANFFSEVSLNDSRRIPSTDIIFTIKTELHNSTMEIITIYWRGSIHQNPC